MCNSQETWAADFTDIWFLFISRQEKTEKMDKAGIVWKFLYGLFIKFLA